MNDVHQTVNPERLDLLVLVWLWRQAGKPAKPAAVFAKSALGPYLDGQPAAELVSASLDRLGAAGDVARHPPTKKSSPATFTITEAGEKRAAAFLGVQQLPPGKTFAPIAGKILPALALGLPIPTDTKQVKALTQLAPLAVCASHFKLDVPLDRGPDAARIELLKLALSKSNGVPPYRIRLGKVPDGELPALVVAPLVEAGGTAASKVVKLIEAKACSLLEVSKPAQIKSAAVRRWLRQPGESESVGASRDAAPGDAAQIDPERFAAQVHAAARQVVRDGNGGVNNLGDQVLIRYCWRAYERLFGAIAFESFRRLLIESNTAGRLVLVREDLVPEDRAPEFRDSEVTVGASSYHYLRTQP